MRSLPNTTGPSDPAYHQTAGSVRVILTSTTVDHALEARLPAERGTSSGSCVRPAGSAPATSLRPPGDPGPSCFASSERSRTPGWSPGVGHAPKDPVPTGRSASSDIDVIASWDQVRSPRPAVRSTSRSSEARSPMHGAVRVRWNVHLVRVDLAPPAPWLRSRTCRATCFGPYQRIDSSVARMSVVSR